MNLVRLYEKVLFIAFIIGAILLVAGTIFILRGQSSFFPVAVTGAALTGLAGTLSISLQGVGER